MTKKHNCERFEDFSQHILSVYRRIGLALLRLLRQTLHVRLTMIQWFLNDFTMAQRARLVAVAQKDPANRTTSPIIIKSSIYEIQSIFPTL